MNCLLLLIILFCCNGNGNFGRGDSCAGNCNTRRSRDRGCSVENRNMDNCNMRNQEQHRTGVRMECGCEGHSSVNSHTTPPSMPRTQFPYLDVEPRTCGCEENQKN